MATFELKSSQFRQEREESWRELEHLVRRFERAGINELSARQLGRLPTLYRSAISSLSVARAISLDRSVLEYLESLVGRAYISVYSTKRPALDAVREFLLVGFPSTVRYFARYLAASIVLLGLGVLCGFLLTLSDSERYYSLVPAELAGDRSPASTTESLRGALYTDAEDEEEGRVLSTLNIFASFLFTHNAKIGILCFALGFAAGAPVVFLLFYNGLILGALGGLYHSRGLGMEFWAWVMPHGVTELGAVCLCGMAGFALGMAVVFPGERSRLDNLARRGRRAAMAVIGAVILFFFAAIIEGFFRQLVNDVTVRWALAGATLLLWTGYFVFMGRGREPDTRG